jgi:hypothetical protein
MGALPAAIAPPWTVSKGGYSILLGCASGWDVVAGSCSSADFCGDGDLASGKGCAGAAVAGVPAVCAGSAGFTSGDPVATAGVEPPGAAADGAGVVASGVAGLG